MQSNVDVTVQSQTKADAYAFGGALPYALRFPSGDTPRFARLQLALHQAPTLLHQHLKISQMGSIR